jgi:hypothetical protein
VRGLLRVRRGEWNGDVTGVPVCQLPLLRSLRPH